MSVEHVWAGASTDTSFWARAKVTGSSTRLAVDTDPALPAPTFYGPDTPTADGMVSLTATGLTAGTRYHYALEDDSVLDTDFVGSVLTHPVAVGERASYVFGAAGDAGLVGSAGDDSFITDQVSDNPVFDTMRAQSLSEGWLHFSHLGDLHYRDIATADPALYRDAYDDVLSFLAAPDPFARQGLLYRNVATTYVWDDHDFGPNNSDRTAAGNTDANAVYRERVPHYTLDSASAIYQSWQIGRVLYIASDVRSFRDPNSDPQTPSKTMLGSAQKSWMEDLLVANAGGAEALVWVMPSQWIATTSDSWASFTHERDELVTMLGDTRWLDRTVQLTADKHALAFSSGPGNRWGGFPIFMFASMDANFGSIDAQWDLGMLPTRQGYGTVTVEDRGHTISLTGTGYVNGAVWKSHAKHVHVGNPVLALDYGAHLKPPFKPTVDTENAVNDMTAKRQGGGEARYVEETGPRSIQDPPDGITPYRDQVTVQVADDDQLGDQASWPVHLGTSPDARVSDLSIDLARSGNTAATVADVVADAELGDKLAISNPPEDLPPDDVELIAEGYSETLGEYEWGIAFNASQGALWNVGRLPPGGEETARPDRPNRLDTTGSELTTAVTDTDSEFLVHTPQDGIHDRAVWITAMKVLNDNFDFETDLSGWVANGGTIARVATPGSAPFPGEWSLELTPDGVAEFPNAGSDQFPVTPGEDYTVSGWVRCTEARTVSLNINWFDSGMSFLSTGSNDEVVAANTWTFLQATFTAPGTAAFANMAPGLTSFPASSVLLYGDILTIRPAGGMPEQSPYDLRLGGETVRATSVEPLHWDAFGRTETDTWGTSTSGLAWVETGGAATDRAVAGGVGTITLPSSPGSIRFQRSTDDVGDCEVHVTMSPDQVATGGSMLPSILFRFAGTGDFYRARLHFGTGGDMFTSVTRGSTAIGIARSLLFSYSAGEVFHLRARIIGHRVLMRAWPDTQAEPVVWHTDETVTSALGLIESGAVGVTLSTFNTNTNVNPVVSYDQFEVVSPQRVITQRSLNEVVKPHAIGAAVSLARPAVLGL